MLRYCIFIVLVAFVISCSKPNVVKISGNIENGEGNMLYFEKVDVDRIVIVDSVRLKSNNRFAFRTNSLQYPSFFNIRTSNRNFITLLVEPGETIEFLSNSSDLLTTAKITGSPGSEALQILNLQLRNTLSQLSVLYEAFDKTDSEAEKAVIEVEIQKLFKNQRRFSIGFILDNMESLASLTALYQKYDDENWVLDELHDLQYMKIVSESLGKIWPESPHVQALVKDTESKLANYNLSLLLAKTAGKEQDLLGFPDIALSNPDGDTLKLSSLDSRFVLLIFSSSLNHRSVQHDLSFRPVFEVFKNRGFDIYQVSFENNINDWRRNISFNELNWNHVSELNMLNSHVAAKYNVSNLPANFLIDKQSGIVARDITPGELSRRLSAIFN